MSLRFTIAGSIVAVAVLATTGVSAQRWGSPAPPRVGACFYQDANFQGRSFCVAAGENLPSVPPGMNDQISSIRIFGNGEVLVFKDGRFRGPSARFNTSVRNLRNEGWNDEISSARVAFASPSWGRGVEAPVWGGQPIPREGACFYKQPDFRGQYFCVPRGGSLELVPPGFNDQISSIRVLRSAVMIFMDRDFQGRSTRLTSDAPNLRGSWGNSISSMRVY